MTDDRTAAASAAHAAFHFALYDAADSAWLLRLIRPVWETSERYCLEVPQCRQLTARGYEHRVILESCVAHDSDSAALALHDHLATTANNISLAMGGEALFELGRRAVKGRYNRFEAYRSLIVIAVLIGVLVLGAGALYAYDHGHRDKIAKGVTVAGIDVGGLSAAQARARLQREYLPRFEQPVVVRFHAHRFKLSPAAAP